MDKEEGGDVKVNLEKGTVKGEKRVRNCGEELSYGNMKGVSRENKKVFGGGECFGETNKFKKQIPPRKRKGNKTNETSSPQYGQKVQNPREKINFALGNFV